MIMQVFEMLLELWIIIHPPKKLPQFMMVVEKRLSNMAMGCVR